ncbi:unnamed protein product [Rotaria magnacalcarata]|uniref:Uncharacterized protein n=1 Tax=Rotaria magnacalcarata TaxID=392030 RepID=A0A816QQF9_9BILA|nr:unnamed protein product [Rotaria magnacalcarata]
MNSNFANYLFNQFACHRKNDGSKHCQLGHLRQEDDSLVRLLFPFTQIKYYQIAHVGRIRLCTRNYTEGKVADDSNIMFIFDNVQHPGKNRSNFPIDDGEPHSLLHTSQILLHSLVKSMARRILFTSIFFSQQLLSGVTFR